MISEKAKNKLVKFHGLDPEKHTDSDVDDAIKNAVTPDDLDDLQNRAKAGDEATAALAEADLAKYANRIGTDADVVASWKEDLIANRAATIKKLEAIPAPTGAAPVVKQPVHNRANAGNPASIDQGAKGEAHQAIKVGALIRNRAEKLKEEGTPEQMAWLRAAEEIPSEIEAGLHK